jgi:simple sugar transport system permease protein
MSTLVVPRCLVSRRLLSSTDGVAALTAVALFLALGIANPQILSVANLFDLARNCLVNGVMALGVVLVLIAGGIDVSFTAIAAFAMYGTLKLALGTDMSMLAMLVIGSTIGGALGLVNGVLIAGLELPTFIVTLGTLSLFRGALLTLLGTTYIVNIPPSMVAFGNTLLFQIRATTGVTYSLPASFLILVGAAILMAVLLRATVWGRKVYALGGSELAAQRLGISVVRIKLAVYVLAGTLAGLAGVLHAAEVRTANPFDIVGTELNVIAAVVLGGARVSGGYGTVCGTLLGVALVTVINTSLLLLGVPSYWNKVAVGLLILLGTGLPILVESWQSRRR